MHAVDLLARSQEHDDKELKAWHNFFGACIKSNDDPIEALQTFTSIYDGPKVDDVIDAQLLCHACNLMATIVCDASANENTFNWPFNRVRNNSTGTIPTGATTFVMLPHHGLSGHVYDRISHLLRSSPDPSALSLVSLARRLLNVYSGKDVRGRLQSNHAAVLDRLGFSKRFSQCCLGPVSQSSSDSHFAQIDNLIQSCPSPSSYLISSIARYLSHSIKQKKSKDLWKSLLRLSSIRLQQGLIAQALLILDDIEEHIFADCDTFDWGILFQTRTEGLLKLSTSPFLSDPSPLIIDAFHNLQLAIACFDRAGDVSRLTRCVLMACLLSNKLKANPFTNFYSVKAAQIRSSMDCTTRFFPTDGKEFDDIANVREFTGQPKLPFESLHSTLPSGPVPTSPVGRGMQTLIAWKQ